MEAASRQLLHLPKVKLTPLEYHRKHFRDLRDRSLRLPAIIETDSLQERILEIKTRSNKEYRYTPFALHYLTLYSEMVDKYEQKRNAIVDAIQIQFTQLHIEDATQKRNIFERLGIKRKSLMQELEKVHTLFNFMNQIAIDCNLVGVVPMISIEKGI